MLVAVMKQEKSSAGNLLRGVSQERLAGLPGTGMYLRCKKRRGVTSKTSAMRSRPQRTGSNHKARILLGLPKFFEKS